MIATRAARRYARAIFDIALSEHTIEDWRRDLQAMTARLSSPDVLAFIANPTVPVSAKQAVIDQTLVGMERRRLSLAYLLVERGRLAELGAVSEEFERLAHQHEGVTEAVVTTAVALPEASALDVERRLGALTGTRVILHRRVDPSIIGGLVVRLGDRLIDGSIATRLEALRAQLAD
jgi:F-type H+-transporting ATPase subunit delta